VFAQTPKTDKNAEKWIAATLKGMTLREKIGQMVMVRMSGEFTNLGSERFAELRRHVNENKLGGFILFRGEANSIATQTNELQRISKLPLLFAADYERGLRMQLRTGTPFTTNMGVGATGDVQAAYRQGKIIAEEMRAIGVNWLFAPVADVNNNPDNPVINIRSFGADAARVGEFASALARGVRDGGALATLKHFPGHGDTAADSHIGLAVIPVDRARLDSLELTAFRRPINEGVDAVMTAHVALPQVTGDEVPATLNPKISTDILRKDMGFKGIITTDAMEMGAIKKTYSDEKSVVMAVKAGADIVLLPNDAKKTIDAIEAAVRSGELTEARLDESVRRLLAAKYRLGLVQNRMVDLARVNQTVEKPENVREANATAEKSITLLRNGDNILPMTAERANKTLFVVVAADDDPVEGVALIPEIQRRAPRATVVRLDPRSTKDEYEKVLDQAKKFDSIVLAPFVKRAALKGTVALPENQTKFVREMIDSKRPVAVIAFGSPYLIRQFPEAKNYVVAYAIEEVAQMAAARTLFGEVPFQGKMPVSVPGIFEIGAGINR
ncbi:MAG TPA: glycoside hydrolase family 3 N-terminal domain-containing protein, partial [Pyrinomonadaceae bacterium]|nr:glycoside hydrolase family 3 N-terminal domain-containing protein [Pyrinomonadaceae bacterium]